MNSSQSNPAEMTYTAFGHGLEGSASNLAAACFGFVTGWLIARIDDVFGFGLGREAVAPLILVISFSLRKN